MVRRCWVAFNAGRPFYLYNRPTVLVKGADEDCLDFFPRLSFLFFYLPLSGRRPDIDRNTITKGL